METKSNSLIKNFNLLYILIKYPTVPTKRLKFQIRYRRCKNIWACYLMQSVQVASGFESTLSDILSHLEGHNGLGLELGPFTKN